MLLLNIVPLGRLVTDTAVFDNDKPRGDELEVSELMKESQSSLQEEGETENKSGHLREGGLDVGSSCCEPKIIGTSTHGSPTSYRL